MKHRLILCLLVISGCWTVEPMLVQKQEYLDRARYQAKTYPGERIGGDNVLLMADSLVFTFNDIEWRNAVHLDSLAELSIASSGLGGLAGALFGGALGGLIGAGIGGTLGIESENNNIPTEGSSFLGGFVGFIIGVPAGMFAGIAIGASLETHAPLNFRTMTTAEKIETLNKHLSD